MVLFFLCVSEAVKSVRINTAMGKKSAMLLSIVCNNIIIYYHGQDAIGRMFTPKLVIGMYWGKKKVRLEFPSASLDY